MRRAVILALGTALCAAPIALAPIAAAAQTKAAKPAAAYKAPRNVFGQPDLTGNWTNATLTNPTRPAALGARSTYTEEEVAKMERAVVQEVEDGNRSTDPNAPPPPQGGETYQGVRPEFAAAGGSVGGYNRGWLEPGNTVMRVRGEPRTSFLTTPNGQVPPRKAGAPAAGGFGGGGRGAGGPGGARAPNLVAASSYEVRSLGERCIISFGRNAGPPMFPNGFYNNNYKFVQSADSVAILVEMVHDTRMVRLNSRHRADGVRPWMGDAIGWWDGDTLVVETTNIPQRQAYSGSWENLKVTERFTRVGKDRLLYQFTIDDPTIWEKPWGGEYEFAPLNGEIFEYACHEGNYALPGILRASTADAEEALKAAKPAAAPTGGAQ